MPEKQVLIRPGMDESIDPRHLPEGTPRILQNTRVKQGARFEKRPGQHSLGATGLSSLGAAYGCWLAEMTGRPVVGVQNHVLDGSGFAPLSCRTYRRDAAGGWIKLGRHGVVVPERRFSMSVDSGDTGKDHTCAVVAGTLYVAHSDVSEGTTVTYYAVDPNGVVLRQDTLSDASTPRLVFANGVLYLVTREPSGSGTDIEVRSLSTIDFTLSSPTTLGSTLSASSDIFDAAPVEGGSTWVIAYPESSTEIRVRVMSGTSSSVSTTITTDNRATCIGVAAYQGEHVCVAYVDGTTVEASILQVSDLSGSTYTVRAAAGSETYRHQCCPVRVGTSTFQIVMGGTDSSTSVDSAFMAHARLTSGGTLTGPYKIFHLQPASRPWTVGDSDGMQTLLWAHNRNDTSSWISQARHFIVELQPLNADGGGANIAAISYQHVATYGASVAFMGHQPEAPEIATGRRATCLMWNDPGPLSGLDAVVWRNALASDSIAGAHRQVIETGGAIYVSGGALYDGAEGANEDGTHYMPENGFPAAPEISVQIASGGSMTAGREYSVSVVYRAMDSLGRIHRSAPSAVKTATPTGAHKKMLINVTTAAGTGRIGDAASAPVAEVYRSWDGGPYYYSTPSDSVAATAAEVTVSDTFSDSTLEANHTLYTDLGILATWPPDGARLICQGGNRLFTVGWRPNVVQFSKLFVPTAPWEFCDDDAFRIFVPERITALGWMDGALVIFSARRIYVVTGDGPNDQGVGVFASPREVPATCGADSPHVVEGRGGLYYYGAQTIWLLPRGFGPPVDIGAQIQRTLATYPYLRGAVRCANNDYDLIHFLLAAGDTPTSATIVAVWDERLNGWSRDQLSCDIGAIGAVDGVLHALLATWSSIAASPVRKLDGACGDLDNSGQRVHTEMRVGFGDWRPWGPLGHGRLNRLQIHGEVRAPCDLNVVTVTDGVTGGYAVGHTMHAMKSMSGLGQFYAERAGPVEAGGAFRFELYDSVASGVASGIVLHSLAYEASESAGLRKLSREERF